jgi:hypothetical protein
MILRNALAALILTAGAIVLAGCGKQALLARPAPLFGPRTQPSAEAATQDAMTRRALADAAPYAPLRAPLSLNEMRRVETKRGPHGETVTTVAPPDPSAPQPPGSPEELTPESSAPDSSASAASTPQ